MALPGMQASLEGRPEAPAFGALLFSCNGRGKRLYGAEHPHYDSHTLHSFVPVPSVGFFCNGMSTPILSGAVQWLICSYSKLGFMQKPLTQSLQDAAL